MGPDPARLGQAQDSATVLNGEFSHASCGCGFIDVTTKIGGNSSACSGAAGGRRADRAERLVPGPGPAGGVGGAAKGRDRRASAAHRAGDAPHRTGPGRIDRSTGRSRLERTAADHVPHSDRHLCRQPAQGVSDRWVHGGADRHLRARLPVALGGAPHRLDGIRGRGGLRADACPPRRRRRRCRPARAGARAVAGPGADRHVQSRPGDGGGTPGSPEARCLRAVRNPATAARPAPRGHLRADGPRARSAVVGAGASRAHAGPLPFGSPVRGSRSLPSGAASLPRGDRPRTRPCPSGSAHGHPSGGRRPGGADRRGRAAERRRRLAATPLGRDGVRRSPGRDQVTRRLASLGPRRRIVRRSRGGTPWNRQDRPRVALGAQGGARVSRWAALCRLRTDRHR